MINSPIFYMGNKYKLLPQLLPIFPDKINTFYDLFGGSGSVSLNVKADKIIYNELNYNVYKLFELFKIYDYNTIINHIENRIKQFQLPRISCDVRTKHYQEEYKQEHNNNYLKFRAYYNKSNKNYLDLYTLTFFSFCNLIRFNSKSEFNMPFGNRCFLEEHKPLISYCCYKMQKINIELKNQNALDMIRNNLDKFNQDDFIYLDPPYTNTMAVYNEQRAFGGWNINNDLELFSLLEELNKRNIKWGLSNVFKNKDYINQHLIDWCNKNNWNVNHLDCEYASLGKGNSNTDEVYICNYNTPKQMTIFDFI